MHALQALCLAVVLSGCNLTSRDENTSQELQEVASGKSLQEITIIGDRYVHGGPGVEPDPAKGVQYIKYAADQGHSPAICALAGIYLNGLGVDKNVKQSQRLYTISANQGYGHAQFNLGVLLMDGREVEPDLESAYYYLSLASRNKRDLGVMTQDAARLRDICAGKLSKQQTRYIDANLLLQHSS